MPIHLLIMRIVLAFVLYAGVLFGVSLDFGWVMGWVFIALTLGIASLEIIALNFRNPGLVRERVKPAGKAEPFDRILSRIIIYAGVVYLVVAGLDHRFSWSPQVPLFVQIGASLLYVLLMGFSYWAMHVNSFFSSVVRIQADRGQTVCKEGPYRIVRHPGYSGAVLAYLAMPLMLSTLWLYIPLFLVIIAFIVRIILEEKVLREKLPGYIEYARETRWRLIPFVW